MATWCICFNVKYFNIVKAIEDDKNIYFKKNASISEDDTVYIYVSRPFSKLLYKAKVMHAQYDETVMTSLKTYISIPIDTLKKGIYYQLKIEGEFLTDLTHYKMIMKNGMSTIQGPSRARFSLINYLKEIEKNSDEYMEI